jgi:uncharacterized protein (DUF2062 family)
VFKRRAPRSYLHILARTVYPRGGWWRAVLYVVHRLRRLPDPAHKISRGIAAGVFTSFTPFFGLHFLIAAVVAWAIRGNMIAALLSTFVGNPLTFPLIATVSVELGTTILGDENAIPLGRIFGAFSNASAELWHNLSAIFTDEVAHWGRLENFFWHLFLPYLVGGLIPGLIAGAAAYALSRPLISAYQKARIGRMKRGFARRRARADKAEAAMKAE